jgi:hypothetical protein
VNTTWGKDRIGDWSGGKKKKWEWPCAMGWQRNGECRKMKTGYWRRKDVKENIHQRTLSQHKYV